MFPYSLNTKLVEIPEKYSGVSRFKLGVLLWICSSILHVHTTCLQQLAQFNAPTERAGFQFSATSG